MYYLRYKLYSLNNAMLESSTGNKAAVLDLYRSIADLVVYAQLWHTNLGFCYTIV